jgi:hypothetical protein
MTGSGKGLWLRYHDIQDLQIWLLSPGAHKFRCRCRKWYRTTVTMCRRCVTFLSKELSCACHSFKMWEI